MYVININATMYTQVYIQIGMYVTKMHVTNSTLKTSRLQHKMNALLQALFGFLKTEDFVKMKKCVLHL